MKISTIPTIDALRPAWGADIDFPWNDAPAWEEAKHPRGQPKNPGQFAKTGASASAKGKQREQQASTKEQHARKTEKPAAPYDMDRLRKAAQTLPQPTKYNLVSGGKFLAIAKDAMLNGKPAPEAAIKIIDACAEYKHHNVARHANAVLRHMEEAYGLPTGALGKALPKRVDPPPPLPPPDPPPGARQKTEPPPPVVPPSPPKKDHPKSIREVMANRTDWTEPELNWHKFAWDSATPEFLAAMQNTKALFNVYTENATSHYKTFAHTITMDPHSGTATWRHEYGHAMDFDGDYQRSKATEMDRQIEAKAFLAKRDLRGRGDPKVLEQHGLTEEEARAHVGQSIEALVGLLSGTSTANITSMHHQAAGPEERIMLLDFLGAFTNNKIGYGHDDGYYRRDPAKHTAEMFANYVCLTQGPSGKVYRAVLHAVAPKCCDYFARIIRERAARGPTSSGTGLPR